MMNMVGAVALVILIVGELAKLILPRKMIMVQFSKFYIKVTYLSICAYIILIIWVIKERVLPGGMFGELSGVTTFLLCLIILVILIVCSIVDIRLVKKHKGEVKENDKENSISN